MFKINKMEIDRVNGDYPNPQGKVSGVPIKMKNMDGRIGSHAISTVNFNSWANDPIVQDKQKVRKTKGAKDATHKIFVECANVTQDQFWVEKFINGSIGKFPSKFSFHDGLLSYRKGSKCNTLEVSNNPYEASQACMEFFRSNGGIFSPIDEQNSLELQYTRSHMALTQQQLTWGDANKKEQEGMLSYYITDMKEIMRLSDSESEQLRQTIRLGVVNKFFGKHNVTVENNRIQSIGGLLWNNETRKFYIDPQLKPNSTRTYTRKKDGPASIDATQKDTIPQFNIKWKKYVELLDKKIANNDRRQRRVIVVNSQGGTNQRYLHLVTTGTTTTPKTDTVSSSEDYTDEDEEEEE